MDIMYNNKELIAVEYPGTVVDVDNMTKTLGGEKEMFSVFRDSSKRLELKFRPNDPYCKTAHGDRFNTTSLLLKIKKRTKKSENHIEDANSHSNSFKVEFLGIVCTTYKFKALADFQILPVVFDKNENRHKSLIPDLLPKTLHSSSWLQKDVPLFIPPHIFSRFDLPQNGYSDIHDKVPRHPDNVPEVPPNIICQSRKKRSGFAVFSSFENKDVISEPKPESVLQLKKYPIEVQLKKEMDVLFNERPVWSRNALLGRLKCERARLRHSLPCAGYYFTNGPWRTLWVKFGYDPRKDPRSKIYQIMDLRINPNIPINEGKVKRRSSYALPTKNPMNQQRIATINTDCLVPTSKENINEEDIEKIKLLAYKYLPGELPTYRQCFYQLCDIHLESVQKLIHENDGQEDFCHEKDGWCIPGTIDKCRELIIEDIQKTVKDSKQFDG